MRHSKWVIFSILPLLAPQAALSQGMMEMGAANSMSAGLGSGLMGTLKGSGAAVGRTYQSGADSLSGVTSMTPAQALQLQNHAVDQYTKVGMQYQAKKQWQNAEKSFEYVLKVSVLRDGPGSPTMIPTLQRLADVCAAEGKDREAISYQERVLGLVKNLKSPDAARTISAQVHLANFYIQKQDYRAAEPILKECFDLAELNPSLSYDKRRAVTKPYAMVLRSLHKDSEALKVEPPPIELTPLVVSPKTPASSGATATADTTISGESTASAASTSNTNTTSATGTTSTSVTGSVKALSVPLEGDAQAVKAGSSSTKVTPKAVAQ